MDTSTPDTPPGAAAIGQREFREIADFAPVMIWRSGLDSLCDWFNKPWLEFTGRTLEQELGLGWAEGVHPDDHDRCVDLYSRAFEAREPFSMEYRLRRFDGEYRWLLDNGSPFQRDGEFAGFFGSCVDISFHHDAERRQQLLIDELNHRVRNTLAIVQGIARQTFDGVGGEAPGLFSDRIQALARAHALLTDAHWQPVDLREMVALITAPWGDASRLLHEGPAVMLPSTTAVLLALALQELCTNSVRFGALSVPDGQVRLTWRCDGGRFELRWSEAGAPPAPATGHRGFGTRLLERAVPAELRGEARLAFTQTGLEWHLLAPLPRVRG